MKIKKFKFRNIIYRILVMIVILIITLSMEKLFEYLLIDDIENYSRLTIHEMYSQDDIDILFLGSSHCFMGIDPSVIDKELKKKTFNAGTVSQLYDGSYAILKEADRIYDLEEVYMDLYYAQGLMENKKDRTIFDRTYLISDYMRMSPNRIRFITQASTKENWINGFSPARRNWRNIFDSEIISDITENKNIKYKNYEYLTAPVSDYLGKGFVGFKKKQEPEHNWCSHHFEEIPTECVTEENQKELIKIIDYCRENDISLKFIVVPMSDLMLADIGNYDNYIDYMKNFARQNGVDYVDFNLCKRDVFSSEDSLFYDESHLNIDGARVFSKTLAEYMLGNLGEEAFFESYEKKVQGDDFKVLGYFVIDYDQNVGRTFEIVDNGKQAEEYKVELIRQTKEGTEIDRSLIQDYSENKIYEIPKDDFVKLIVDHREKGDDDIMKIEYCLSPHK